VTTRLNRNVMAALPLIAGSICDLFTVQNASAKVAKPLRARKPVIASRR
jgi:hypothetical protein